MLYILCFMDPSTKPCVNDRKREHPLGQYSICFSITYIQDRAERLVLVRAHHPKILLLAKLNSYATGCTAAARDRTFGVKSSILPRKIVHTTSSGSFTKKNRGHKMEGGGPDEVVGKFALLAGGEVVVLFFCLPKALDPNNASVKLPVA